MRGDSSFIDTIGASGLSPLVPTISIAVSFNNSAWLSLSAAKNRIALSLQNVTAWLLRNLMKRFQTAREFHKALEHLIRGVELTRTTGDRRREAINLIGIGRLYLRLGDFERARR